MKGSSGSIDLKPIDRWIDAPIWEMGLSASTTGSDVLDPYRVREMHALFEGEYPRISRQHAFEGLQLFPPPNTVMLPTPQFTLADQSQMLRSRWWLSSTSEDRIIQLQEDFVSYNWRRLSVSASTTHVYPGFNSIKNNFADTLSKIIKWKEDRDEEAPIPMVSDILYDNLVSMTEENGETRRLSDVFALINPERQRRLSGFNMGWFETIGDYDPRLAQLRVALLPVGMPVPGEAAPRPFAKLTLNARAQTASWADAYTFFDVAHEQIHRAFADLTTQQAHANWGVK